MEASRNMSFHNRVIVKRTCLVLVGVLIGTSALAQRGGGQDAPPPAFFTATSIPGVVAAGTRIELVKGGLQRTEGPVAMKDGSMLVSSTGILKVDLSDNVSTFIENSNQTNGMGWDQQGRLISVQRARGNEKVGVLYPATKVTTLADN